MVKTEKRRKFKNKNKTMKKIIKNIVIDSNFESGNIKLLSKLENIINLEIENEPYPKSTKKKYQNWFYFKVSNVTNKRLKFIIHNIRNFDNDWKGFNVCYSYDNKNWKRKSTKLSKNKLVWNFNSKKRTVYFAYYPPYPFSKSKALFKNAKIIGRTKDRNPILMQTFGTGPKKIWLISGQHPGETINSWMLEGFLKRMLERKSKLYKKYTFYIIPNANPDGNKRGHWYVTSKGINLNRDWDKFKSPEVKAIKKQIDKIGFFLVFDLHGDEGCKKHFLVELKNKHPLFDKINKKLNKKNKHFQIENYYKGAYMKEVNDTLDEYTTGITVEGSMKHPLYNHKTIQDEPLKIGKTIADILIEL